MRRLVTFFLVIPLLGALTAPAAAQSSTEELLAGMVTEKVEQGVYRIVNDGVRDLSKANDLDIVAGHDGGIWLLRPQRFFRLGGDEWLAWATEKPEYVRDFEVAPDGTVWTVQATTPRNKGGSSSTFIASFDGDGWTTHNEGSAIGGGDVEVTPDGTVWAMWQDPEQEAGQLFGYLDEDCWQTLGHLAWADQLLVASPDDIWAIEIDFHAPDHLVRFVDGAWQRLDAVGWPVLLRLGPKGTVWGVFPGDPDDLVRFDGSEWNRWPLKDIGFYGPAGVEVAPDGSVWYASGSPADTCGGVARFDGVTPDQYLSGVCVHAIDISADGAVWMLAKEKRGPNEPRHLYVITPEAVAVAE